jgi:signal transduction histidine kinase
MSSLLTRLTLALCVAAGFLLPAGGCFVYFTAERLLLRNFDGILAAKADALITTSEMDRGKLETDLEVQEFAGFGSAAGGDYFEFRTPDGALLARSPSLRRDRLPSLPAPLTRKPQSGFLDLPDGRPGRALWLVVPVKSRDHPEGATLVELGVASDSASLSQTLHTLGMVVAGTATVGLLVGLLVLRGLVRRSLQPVSDLAREVQEIPVDDPARKIDATALPAELVPVGRRVNDLLSRAREAIERERRFSSHAAHELRTPLAELRAIIELMAEWPDERTTEQFEEAQKVLKGLEQLLQKLTLLSRAEAGRQPVHLESLDPAALGEGAVERFRAAAELRGLSLVLKPGSGPLRSDPVIWDAIANNLLENAVSHSPAGATITVESSAEQLAISNPAPRLSSADLPHLMERFWKKHSRHGEGEEIISHSGLGLSLVAIYAQLLGTTATAELQPGGILAIRVPWSRTEGTQG